MLIVIIIENIILKESPYPLLNIFSSGSGGALLGTAGLRPEKFIFQQKGDTISISAYFSLFIVHLFQQTLVRQIDC